MSITASSLYRDSFNFMRNQFTSILLLALLTAFITVILNQGLTPNSEQLSLLTTAESDFSNSTGMGLQEMIRQMTPEQQKVLLKVSAAGTFSALIGNVLLVGGMLMLIQQVSIGKRISALRAIGASAPILLRLLLLLLITTLLVQIGFVLLVVPGVIISVMLALAPILVAIENVGVFAALRTSTRLAIANIKIILPAVVLWLLAKLLPLMLVTHLTALSPMVAMILLALLGNLISALLLIYLFRLYMLLRKPEQ